MISLVVPFIADTEESKQILNKCLEYARRNASTDDIELVLIDNGSDERLAQWPEFPSETYLRHEQNQGVLTTFKQGLQVSSGDIICFIHSDVLLHEPGWDARIQKAFDDDPKLGLAGLFGARGVAPDGGRIGAASHMLGAEWGITELRPAALHHGMLMTEIMPAAVLDGVGMFFSRAALRDMADNTDIFADWRAPHHFYDRIMPLKMIELGYHVAVIGIQFDHWSGATANSSDKYMELAERWCDEQGHDYNGVGWDDTVYWVAERQWRAEYATRLDCTVDDNYNYSWRHPA